MIDNMIQKTIAILLSVMLIFSITMINGEENADAARTGAKYSLVVKKIKKKSREVYYIVTDCDRDGKKELLISKKNSYGSGWTVRMYKRRNGKIKKVFNEIGYAEELYFFKKGRVIVTYMCSHANEQFRYYKKSRNNKYKLMGYRTRYAKKAGAFSNTSWEYYVKDEYVGKRMFARRVGKKAKGRKKVYEIFEWKKWSRH